MIPVDPTVNLALIVSLGIALVSLGIWVGAIGQRVTGVEHRTKVHDEAVESQRVAVEILNSAVTASRMDMLKGFAPIEYLRTVEGKLDKLAENSSEIAATQASQGATLAAIQETLRDLKARTP